MEFLYPFVMAGVPLFILSFLLVFWAIKHEYISADDKKADLRGFKKEYNKDKSAHKVNRIHRKWLFFGGGFYGLMALVTYVHVEAIEIYDFFLGYTTFADFIDQVSISAVISLIIESFLNLIPAFIWFLYWPKHIVMQNGLYWLIAAYIGYQLGTNFAKWWVKRNGMRLKWQ